MTKINKLSLLFLSCILFISCSKSDSGNAICNNSDALNYKKSGTCVFPRDSIVGLYSVVLKTYPLQPLQVGDTFLMTVRNGTCVTPVGGIDSVYKYIEINATNSALYPTDWCIYLHGTNFILTDTSGITWSGAPLVGEGSFSNDMFTFNGIVQSSDGDSLIILQSKYFKSSNK
jgi:hypothetical protein